MPAELQNENKPVGCGLDGTRQHRDKPEYRIKQGRLKFFGIRIVER